MKSMKKWLVLCLCLFICMSAGAAYAAEMPNVLPLKDYWYADGYLAQPLWGANQVVVAAQAIELHNHWDGNSPVRAVLEPGEKAVICEIVYVAQPGKQAFRLQEAAAAADGSARIEAGEWVGYISRSGSDTIAVYYKGAIQFMDVIGVVLPPEIVAGAEGMGQWLHVRTESGKAGWCQFQAKAGESATSRWKIVGATGQLNQLAAIVAGDMTPQFRRERVLFTNK